MYSLKSLCRCLDRKVLEQGIACAWIKSIAHRFVVVWLLVLSCLLGACSTTPFSNQLLDASILDGKMLRLSNLKHHSDTDSSSSSVSHNDKISEFTSLPARVELQDVPFFPQERYQCGPAALATVLSYRGAAVTPEDLVQEVYVPGVKGSYDFELAAASRRFNRLAYKLEPNLVDILLEVAAGNPVLVKQNLGLTWVPKWHFAVVVGYDVKTNQVILRSGTKKRWRSSLRAFERTLQRAKYWAITVTNLHHIPVTATPERYLSAVQDVAKIHGSATVLPAYYRAKQRWPDMWLSDFLIANHALLQKRYALAANHFGMSFQKSTNEVLVLNNYAYALEGMGCRKQALQSLQCGLRKEPEHFDLADSLRDIKSQPQRKPVSRCPHFRCL